MLKIGKKLEYALMLLHHLHKMRHHGPISVRALCQIYQLPFDPASKVLQTLQNKGIVHSVQGIHGGYQIAVALEEISLFQLSEIIEGNNPALGCMEDPPSCDKVAFCQLITPLQNLNRSHQEFLKNIFLHQLFSEDSHELQSNT